MILPRPLKDGYGIHKGLYMSYNEKTIIENTIRALDINLFYQQPFVKYHESAKGTKSSYMDIISKVLIDRYDAIRNIGEKIVPRESSFNAKHDGTSGAKGSGYTEKRLAIALFNGDKEYGFGKIFDYEVPLKRKNIDKYGDVDLVAVKGDKIKLIELKIRHTNLNSDETLLRTILEIYTYYKILSRSKAKFIDNFKNKLDESNNYIFQPVILAEEESLVAKHMEGMEKDKYGCLKELIKKMEEEICIAFEYYVYSYKARNFKKDNEGKIVLINNIDIQQIK